jgi:hypothetical protein
MGPWLKRWMKRLKDVLKFLDPCNIVKFITKNPTRCNNVSKFYYAIFILTLVLLM